MSPAGITEHEAQTALPAPEPQRALPEPKNSGSGMKKWLIVLLILLAVAAVIWKIRSNTKQQAAAATKMAAAADRPIPVLVTSVAQKTMPIYLQALGTVTAYNTVTIKSRVDGQLLRVNVREGQAVKQGQLLLEIDSRPYQAAVAQAEGALAKDQAMAANANAEAARYTALYQAGVVSKESQQTQISSAGQSAGSLQADEAAIQAAKVNLAYTRIVSPINGVVGLRQVDPGNIVHASDATGLLLITQMQPISVIFTLPEDQLPQVLQLSRAGKKLEVQAFDRSDSTRLAVGSLLTVDNSIDPTTGTDKVKAVFDNRDGALFPNQFVNVRLILQERQNAVVIPASAVQTGTEGSFVYVVKPGEPPDAQRPGGADAGGASGNVTAGTSSKTHAHGGGQAGGGAAGQGGGPAYFVEAAPVKVDLTEGSQVILASGVNPGDQVVVDGQEKLRNGSKVTPRTVNSTRGAGAKGIGASGGTGLGGASGAGTTGGTGATDLQGSPAPPQGGTPGGRRGRTGGGPELGPQTGQQQIRVRPRGTANGTSTKGQQP